MAERGRPFKAELRARTRYTYQSYSEPIRIGKAPKMQTTNDDDFVLNELARLRADLQANQERLRAHETRLRATQHRLKAT